MGMQVFCAVADIEAVAVIHKHAEATDSDCPDWIDTYIVINEGSHYLNTDDKYVDAWFDIGFMSESGMNTLKWLIQNRIPFSAS